MKQHMIHLACGHVKHIVRLPGVRILTSLPQEGRLTYCKQCKEYVVVVRVVHAGVQSNG